jgi:hypothetical protein
MRRRNSILDSAAMLVIIGILAGAIGGLGIGLMSKSTSASSSASAH